ncbi:MAG: GntR family transcriptional regulator [Hydrogenibacillus schlegelii]|uniref:GntR family transcriptional regulator n=2 Tax=Hydrogenibacillus schlegelii TaxID=1484 RepID=A0A2T5GBQ4_HYDSH|nr:GntR family transcriptional regulator [Hydrogenibacillus schlegelii]PTQ53620.1 MAG: Transcriptional regulator, GntR family [Hydrogenibacillus schlegelii]
MIRIDPEDPAPIYQQIKRQLKERILSGLLPPGTPLPSIRGLAEALRVSVITTRRVYQELEVEGWIRSEQGRGTFVAGYDEAARRADRLALAREALREAIERSRRLGLTDAEIVRLFEAVLKAPDVLGGQGERPENRPESGDPTGGSAG